MKNTDPTVLIWPHPTPALVTSEMQVALGRAFDAAFASLRESVAPLLHPVHVAGVSARFQVRGSFCSTPDDLAVLVASILRPAPAAYDDGAWLPLMTRAHRAEVAAAAVRGYGVTHPAPVPVLAWCRYWQGTTISIGRERDTRGC